MNRRLKKVLQLSATELWVLAQACLGFPLVRIALQFASVAQLNHKTTRWRRPLSTIEAEPENIARLVSIAAHYGLFRASCLEKSLVLRWLLAQRGIDAQIVFGTRKAKAGMQAHAWIEINGMPLNEDHGTNVDFARFEQLKTPQASEGAP